MPRVLIVSASAYIFGGVQSWLDYLVPGLASHGWEPVVGLVSGRLHDAEAYLRDHPFEHVCIIHSRTGTSEGRARSLLRSLESVRPDVVMVANIVDGYMAVSRWRVEMGQDLKLVATLHGLAPDFLQDFKRYRNHLDAVVSTNLLGCDLVEHVSGLVRERIFHAPGGVEIPDDGHCRSGDLREDEDTLRIAFVGRLERFYKRVHDILEIVEAATSAGLKLKVTVAGDGPESDALLASAAHKGVIDHVEFLGKIDHQRVRERVYACNDVLLLTSSSETGPLVAWEAMAEGLILITSDFVGRKREGSLRDGVNCCVFPVGDAAKAVECLFRMRDAKARRALSQAGRKLVQMYYSRSSSIQRWSECLERILDLPSLPPCPIADWKPPRGRLDWIFGPALAEDIRRRMGRRFEHSDPGGEWPHSYGDRKLDDPEFWAMARQLDVPQATET